MADDKSESGEATPRDTHLLFGQEAAEGELLRSYSSGRLPHAWLISGPAGIGKATLAFRFARFLFAGGIVCDQGMAISPQDPVFRRVASGGHADLATIERQFDEEKGKFKKDIAVDDVRRIAPFLRLTPAEGGWRIVIVDGADGMNRNGQNAILKILEEPPKKSLLMLVTERPSAMLPTIRSRCRVLTLPALSDETVEHLIARYRPDIDTNHRRRLSRIAAGSIGRALEIARYDGLGLLAQFLSIAAKGPVDWPAAHALSEKLALASADDTFHSFAQLLVDWLGKLVREIGRYEGSDGEGIADVIPGGRDIVQRLTARVRLEQLLEVWEKVAHLFARSEVANLDRRLTVISAFEVVNAALR